MRKPIAILAAIGAIMIVAIPAFATDIGSIIDNKPEQDNFQLIHVDDLAKLMADPNAHVHLFDADPPEVRNTEGLIPHARPLSSDSHYDVAEELPSNKNAKLVFYCHNLH
jgi:rhodanese-related sulfurtransferase